MILQKGKRSLILGARVPSLSQAARESASRIQQTCESCLFGSVVRGREREPWERAAVNVFSYSERVARRCEIRMECQVFLEMGIEKKKKKRGKVEEKTYIL